MIPGYPGRRATAAAENPVGSRNPSPGVSSGRATGSGCRFWVRLAKEKGAKGHSSPLLRRLYLMNSRTSRSENGPEFGTIDEVENVKRSESLPLAVPHAPVAVSRTPAYLALAAACLCLGMSAIFVRWAG